MRARTVVFIVVACLATVALGAPGAGARMGNGGTGSSRGGVPLPVDGHWYSFEWAEDGLSPVFTFTTDGTGRLRVTDAYCRGDVFEIYDNGALIGTTPVVPVDDDCNEPQPRKPGGAFRDPTYSHGVFVLDGGDHELQLLAIVNFFGGGAGYLGVADAP